MPVSENAGKFAEIADLIVAEKIPTPSEIADLIWYHKRLHDTELELKKRLDTWSENHPIRKYYLEHIHGIGPILSSGLIAWLSPISRFPNPSKLHAYILLSAIHFENECEKGHKTITSSEPKECKVGVKKGKEGRQPCGAPIVTSLFVNSPPKRKAGYLMMGNTRLKTLAWKISSSFEKQNAVKSQYRALYDIVKERYSSREDLAKAVRAQKKRQSEDEEAKGGAKKHIQLMTLRYITKRFLTDLWAVWREGEGLSVTVPYALQMQAGTPHTKESTVKYERPKTDDGTPIPNAFSKEDTAFYLKTAGEIRYLVENFYDVQKLRVESGNRIVAFVKSNYEVNKTEWDKVVSGGKGETV